MNRPNDSGIDLAAFVRGLDSWNAYLDDVETAVAAIEHDLTDDTPPSMPTLNAPGDPMPPQLRERGHRIRALVATVIDRVATRQAGVLAELQTLPSASAAERDTTPASSLGRRLDVHG